MDREARLEEIVELLEESNLPEEIVQLIKSSIESSKKT